MEDGTQSNEASDACGRGQRRSLCAHPCHPSENVGITAELLETSNSRVFGAEIDKEATHGEVVHASCSWTERGGDGLNGAREGRCQRMLEWRPAPTLHELILGWG
jgi:hypothetical protein